jgi:ribosome-binding protein aMBF1 (putative translation factor)
MKKELKKQIQQLEQKMAKSPNNMNNGGSHFLYHREQMIRFKLMQAGISQKKLAKHLKLTESYISKLITGERYNKDFEKFLYRYLEMDYCFM